MSNKETLVPVHDADTKGTSIGSKFLLLKEHSEFDSKIILSTGQIINKPGGSPCASSSYVPLRTTPKQCLESGRQIIVRATLHSGQTWEPYRRIRVFFAGSDSSVSDDRSSSFVKSWERFVPRETFFSTSLSNNFFVTGIVWTKNANDTKEIAPNSLDVKTESLPVLSVETSSWFKLKMMCLQSDLVSRVSTPPSLNISTVNAGANQILSEFYLRSVRWSIAAWLNYQTKQQEHWWSQD